MNKKGLLIAAAAAAAVALFAVTAKAKPEPAPPEPEPVPPGPEPIPPGPKPPPADDDPPNISGDPKGYNTQRFNSVRAVRQWFVNMGYSMVVFSDKALIKNVAVRKFQKNYNTVASRSGNAAMGRLDVDGTAGENTLNALEIAWMRTQDEGKSWNMIVKGL